MVVMFMGVDYFLCMNGFFVLCWFCLVFLDDYEVVCCGIVLYLLGDFWFDIVVSYGCSGVLIDSLYCMFVDVVIIDFMFVCGDLGGIELVMLFCCEFFCMLMLVFVIFFFIMNFNSLIDVGFSGFVNKVEFFVVLFDVIVCVF